MCENVTNLCINWSYTSFLAKTEWGEKETHHMWGQFLSSPELFHTLETWSGLVAADRWNLQRLCQTTKAFALLNQILPS